MRSDFDVIVIGAGFAGLTAARECTNRGLSTLVLEGADRIGGRTYTTRWSNGEPMDVGGTFLHWTMPHIWAEISRYGLQDQIIEAGEELDEMQVRTADGVKVMTYHEWEAIDRRLVEALYEPSREIFPRPYEPLLNKSEVEKWDISIEDRIQQLDFTEEERDLVRAMYAVDGGGDVREVSFLGLLRWYALANHDYDAMGYVLFGNRFKDGTVVLANAIKDDSNAEVRLSTPVAAVASDDDGVTVTTDDGTAVTARYCIVATPSATWNDVTFSPELSSEKQDVGRTGRLQAPGSANIKVRLSGINRRFSILGHPSEAVGSFYTYRMEPDGTQIAQIWPNPAGYTDDPERITAVINEVLPEAKVEEIIASAWTAEDRFSRGGYTMYRPGVLSKDVPHEKLAQPEGRLAFATADISTFWYSWIDGAIESGMRAARQVREMVAGEGA